MGRSGFTDDGGASMMSWLNDSVSCTSTQQDRYDLAFEDPKYLRYLDGDFDLGNAADVAEGAGQNRVPVSSALAKELYAQDIGRLKDDLVEVKGLNKKLDETRLKLEFELAAQDQLIEELEGKLEELKKNMGALKSCAMGCCSIAVAVVALLCLLYDKR